MPRRVPVITREQVTDEHKAAYDEITAIRGRPPVIGPSSVLINSPEMALRLSKALGRSPESWLSMQDAYDLFQAKKGVKLHRVQKVNLDAE